jgi:hypothetical protein
MRLGRRAPGSTAARRAAGRGRRGPPAARRPSRCQGTASSTLQQETKRAISQPTAMVEGAAIRPGRIAADLGPGERRSGRAHGRAHTRTAGRAAKGRSRRVEREAPGRADARAHLPRRGRRPSSRRAAAPWPRLAVGAGRARGRAPEPAAPGRGGSGGRHEGFRRAVAALDSEE